MSAFPQIATAIPQRRYRYGDFGVTILAEIESSDASDYEFIAAFVKDGEGQPRLFVVSERTPPAERAQGSHRLRVINSSMDEVMDVDTRWGRLSDFSEQALQMGAQLLGLCASSR